MANSFAPDLRDEILAAVEPLQSREHGHHHTHLRDTGKQQHKQQTNRNAVKQ